MRYYFTKETSRGKGFLYRRPCLNLQWRFLKGSLFKLNQYLFPTVEESWPWCHGLAVYVTISSGSFRKYKPRVLTQDTVSLHLEVLLEPTDSISCGIVLDILENLRQTLEGLCYPIVTRPWKKLLNPCFLSCKVITSILIKGKLFRMVSGIKNAQHVSS